MTGKKHSTHGTRPPPSGEWVIDFETRSEADLRRIGAHNYAEHPSTEIICLCFKKKGTSRTRLWAPGADVSEELFEALESGLLIAHNAGFEMVILNSVLPRYVPGLPIFHPGRFRCTAAKAAAFGLPRSLEDAGGALGLPVQKDMAGARLLKKYIKPTPKWKKWNLSGRRGPEPEKYFNDSEGLLRIYGYCITDVETEDLLDDVVPNLIPSEREAWILNQRVNARGVKVDVQTAKRILEFIDEYSSDLLNELEILTHWNVTSASQRDRFLKWLDEQGLKISNLQKKTVEDTLDQWE